MARVTGSFAPSSRPQRRLTHAAGVGGSGASESCGRRRVDPGAIAVDSDTPTLPREFLQQAVDCLTRPGADVVLGPTEDGGYYLIGVRAAHRALFDGVPWSTSAVLEVTLRQAAAAGLQAFCLPTWFDVDTPDDLRRLQVVLDGSPAVALAGRTARFLASWRR